MNHEGSDARIAELLAEGISGRAIARQLDVAEVRVRRIRGRLTAAREGATAMPTNDEATVINGREAHETSRSAPPAAPNFAAARRQLAEREADLVARRPALALAALHDADAAAALEQLKHAFTAITTEREDLELAEAEHARRATEAERHAHAARLAAARQRRADARAGLPEALAAVDRAVATLCAATQAALSLAQAADRATGDLPRDEWKPGGEVLPVLSGLGQRVLRPLATVGGMDALLVQWGAGRLPLLAGLPLSAPPARVPPPRDDSAAVAAAAARHLQASRPAPGEPIYGPPRGDMRPTPPVAGDPAPGALPSSTVGFSAPPMPSADGAALAALAMRALQTPASSSPYVGFAANGPRLPNDGLVSIPCPDPFLCSGNAATEATARAKAWAAHYAGRG